MIKNNTKENVREQLQELLNILHNTGFIHNDLNENQIRGDKKNVLKLIDFGKGININNITSDDSEQIELIKQIFKEKDLEKIDEILF